jgi:hypothetical protein
MLFLDQYCEKKGIIYRACCKSAYSYSSFLLDENHVYVKYKMKMSASYFLPFKNVVGEVFIGAGECSNVLRVEMRDPWPVDSIFLVKFQLI